MTTETTTVDAKNDASWAGRARARLRQWRASLHSSDAARRKLELTLALIASVGVLPVLEAAWRPAVAETPEVTSPTAPPREILCDDATAATFVSKFHDAERAAKDDLYSAEVLRLGPYRNCVGHAAAFAGPRVELFHRAATAGRLALVRWMLGAGELDEAVMTTALALGDDHTEVVALLRAHGATDPGLAEAARLGAHGAIRRALDARRHTPAELSLALRSFLQRAEARRRAPRGLEADEHIVRLLLAEGAEVDGETLAALCNQPGELSPDLLEVALAARTPGAIEATLASVTADMPADTVRRLAAEGVDWDLRDGEDDAAMPLVRAVSARNEVAMRLLLELGAPVNRFYKDGSSALQAAVSCNEGDVCGRMTETLLVHGAKPHLRFPDGLTPLFAAAEAGDGRVIRALLDAGARVDERVVRETPFEAAERVGNTTAVRILAARGARFDRP